MDIAFVKIEENNPAFNTNREVDLKIMEIIVISEPNYLELEIT